MNAREIKKAKKINAVFSAPPAKAFTLRALFISALAEGKSILKNGLHAEDQKIAMNALNQFGAKIEFDGKDYYVQGTGGKLISPKETVFVGNSGVTSRFIVPIAGLAEGNSIIDGTERMRERPLQDLIDSLEKIGLNAETNKGCPPVSVDGKTLKGGETFVLGNKSSQYLSAMLIAGPYMEKGLKIRIEGELMSKPYVDITMDVMRAFGVSTVNRDYKDFFVSPVHKYSSKEYPIEGDYSSASYFFAAAAITKGKVRVNNLNPDSKQGDKVLLKHFEKMGCEINYGKDFVELIGKDLKGIEVDMSDCPDVVPTLSVVSAFAKGKTKITNIAHLAIKESNRIETTAQNLKKCGIKADAGTDYLEIHGGSPNGAEVDSFDDHRIAMAFSVMGLAVEGMKITNSSTVAKSFPDFYKEFEKFYEESKWTLH